MQFSNNGDHRLGTAGRNPFEVRLETGGAKAKPFKEKKVQLNPDTPLYQ